MRYLPLANILHHKLRSALSAMGIAIGLCMLVTLSGLSRGSLNEVLNRWAGVDADLIVYPGSTNLTMASGGAIPLVKATEKIDALRHKRAPISERITPAYLARMQIGDREHNVFGLRPREEHPEDFAVFGGEVEDVDGRLPDADGRFARWIAERFAAWREGDPPLEISAKELADHDGLEMAIDTKLAAMLGKGLGETFDTAGHTWTIVGVFRAGPVARAFAPMVSLQYLFGGGIERVTLLFVKLGADVPPGPTAERIRKATPLSVVPTGEYRAMLMQNVGVMYTYVDTVNIVALVIAFLFIMVTLYTMVLQRTREIAILKSMGASRALLMRGVLAESLILTAAGAAVGVAMSFGAGWVIERLRPDLTVTITLGWVGVGLLAALAGGLLAGLYPAWRAAHVEVAENLTLE